MLDSIHEWVDFVKKSIYVEDAEGVLHNAGEQFLSLLNSLLYFKLDPINKITFIVVGAQGVGKTLLIDGPCTNLLGKKAVFTTNRWPYLESHSEALSTKSVHKILDKGIIRVHLIPNPPSGELSVSLIDVGKYMSDPRNRVEVIEFLQQMLREVNK